jgi:integrase
MPKLNKRLVESTKPQQKDTILWDNELTGFMAKITPKGKRCYFLVYRDHNRIQRWKKIGNHPIITCEEAREIARKWLNDLTHGKEPSAKKKDDLKTVNPTINELAARYMAEHAPRKKTSSQKRDDVLWRIHTLPSIGKIKVASLTRDDILRLHASLNDMPITANRVLSLLSKALNLAELWGYRPDGSNTCRHIPKNKENKREYFLSSEELGRLAVILSEEEVKGNSMASAILAIRLLLLTGCRLREILTLQWKEVDFERQCLNLSDSKTGSRVAYLSTEALELLKTCPQDGNNPYVISGKKDQAHLVNLRKTWCRIREKANLPHVRIHDLRHTFASMAIKQKVDLYYLSKLLGHKTIQTTQRYAHLVGDPLVEAANQVGNGLKVIA